MSKATKSLSGRVMSVIKRERETVKCFVISYFRWCVLPVILTFLSASLSPPNTFGIVLSVSIAHTIHHYLPSLVFRLTRSVDLFSPIYPFSTSVPFNLCENHSGLLLLLSLSVSQSCLISCVKRTFHTFHRWFLLKATYRWGKCISNLHLQCELVQVLWDYFKFSDIAGLL